MTFINTVENLHLKVFCGNNRKLRLDRRDSRLSTNFTFTYKTLYITSKSQ